MFNLLHRKCASFLKLSHWVKAWFLPTWVLLGAAKLCIALISFRRLAPHLGISVGVDPWIPLVDPAQETRALQISRVVNLAARYTPWDSNCFPQAVVARLLLGFYGIPYLLAFGLMREIGTPKMKAHAWVASGRIRVTGGESFRLFTTVACFAPTALADIHKP